MSDRGCPQAPGAEQAGHHPSTSISGHPAQRAVGFDRRNGLRLGSRPLNRQIPHRFPLAPFGRMTRSPASGPTSRTSGTDSHWLRSAGREPQDDVASFRRRSPGFARRKLFAGSSPFRRRRASLGSFGRKTWAAQHAPRRRRGGIVQPVPPSPDRPIGRKPSRATPRAERRRPFGARKGIADICREWVRSVRPHRSGFRNTYLRDRHLHDIKEHGVHSRSRAARRSAESSGLIIVDPYGNPDPDLSRPGSLPSVKKLTLFSP
jgi:hypothetical protein